jgi:hypothetical protein
LSIIVNRLYWEVIMQFILRPYQGIDMIRFGMSRDEVRHALKDFSTNFETFNKWYKGEDKNFKDTDLYEDLGIFVYYKPDNTCEAIEMFKPAEPMLDNQCLSGLSYHELRELFEEIDGQLEIDDVGFTSHKFGVGFYFRFGDEDPDAIVEGVFVFPKGHYD